MKLIKLILLFFSFTQIAFGAPSLTGNWKTFDNNGNARSIVRFYQAGGQWNAKIVKVLPVAGKDLTNCTKCTGANKNRPLVNMTIVWGLKQTNNKWTNGTVLDVDSGKTYNCSVTLSPNGQTLYFYASLGPFGKTINWSRA